MHIIKLKKYVLQSVNLLFASLIASHAAFASGNLQIYNLLKIPPDIAPHQAGQASYASIKQTLQYNVGKPAIPSQPWQAMNGPYGGFVQNILVSPHDPDTLYIALVGGVYRSTDSGQHWSLYNKGLSQGAFAKLASDGTNYYVSDGIYIFRSNGDDQGWQPIYHNFSDFIHGIAIKNGILYLLMNYSIVQTNDSGQHWVLTATLPNAFFPSFMKFVDNTLYIGSLNQGMLRSDDNGKTFISISNGLDIKNVFTDIVSVNNVLYLSCLDFSGSGAIYKSVDHGQTWFRADHGLSQQTQAYSLTTQENKLYVAAYSGFMNTIGSNGIYVSTDEGNNWNMLGNGLNNKWVIAIKAANNAIYAGTSDGIYKNTNDQTSWTSINNGMNALQISSIFPLSNGQLLIAANANEILLHKKNNTDQTVLSLPPNLGAGHNIITADASGVIYALFSSVGVYKSLDQGQTWHSLSLLNTPQGNPIFPTSILTDGSTLYIGTKGGQVYKSNNSGMNWQPLTSAPINSTSSDNSIVSMTKVGNAFYASIYGAIYEISADGSGTWQQINVPASNYSEDINKIYGISDQLYLSTGQGFYISSNGGSSWQQFNLNITFPFLSDVYDFAIHGHSFAVGTSLGVYQSDDNGQTWFNNTLIPSFPQVNSVVFGKDTLYAGTMCGMFYQDLTPAR